uniref:Calcium-transporting ATPase n=1 Tax=Vannella robusta TaxID=1487602 RepID=A0A7S4M3N9_9EUKA
MGEIADAIGIFIAVTIVNFVGFYQEYKSEKSVEALKNLTAHHCSVVRDGTIHTILAEDLVVGDIVPIESGYRTPADLRLLQAVNLYVDESILTGETEPREKFDHPVESDEKDNMLFMGTMCVSGRGRGVVTSTGRNTLLGKISDIIQNIESVKTPLQLKMAEIGKQLSILAFAIVAVIFILGVIQKKDMLDMFTIGVSLAVAAIPEGLPIVVTVTLALGVTRMAGRKAIVRKLPAVEALGAATVICSDKTGTLTKNQMTITHVYSDSEYTVGGIGYSPTGDFFSSNQRINPQEHPDLTDLLQSAMLCNNAQFEERNHLIGQPTEGAILTAGFKAGLSDPRESYTRLDEIPFSSKTQIMFTKYDMGRGDHLYHVKGSVERVLEHCKFFSESGETLALTESKANQIHEHAVLFGRAALRVVAVARGKNPNNLVFLGLLGMIDPPKEGVRKAIRIATDSGVKVVMITGDSKETAIAVAKKISVADDQSLAFSSEELVGSNEQQLASIVDHVSVFYRVSPEHKMNIVKAFQDRGHVVAMTGDGVNDAPALKIADIGIAMGLGTDAAKEASEMILVDDNLSTIIAAIEEGKSIYNNIKNFLRFQLTTSIATLSMIAASTIFGFPSPLNPIQILWINIIMDGPPAQSLGVEPFDQAVLSQPPRKAKDPIFTAEMILSICITATVMVFGTLATFYYHLDEDNLARASTIAFTTFVMFQLFNAMNCRSETRSAFKLGLTSNKFFILAILGCLIMQLAAIYFPWFQLLFETESIGFSDLYYSTLIGSSVFFMDEIRKYASSFNRPHIPTQPIIDIV